MDRSLHNTHAKLLAFDFLSLTQSSTDSTIFTRDGAHISRVEVVGVVTSWDHNPDKFLKFTVDDGTGCVTCVFWLNHLVSPYFARRNPLDVRVIASVAKHRASEVKLGAVVRVRGRIGSYRGQIQVTVSDVVTERDPNAEMLHWLDCVRLARKCYDAVPSS